MASKCGHKSFMSCLLLRKTFLCVHARGKNPATVECSPLAQPNTQAQVVSQAPPQSCTVAESRGADSNNFR